jgi:alpha-L-arabinofuranosidase
MESLRISPEPLFPEPISPLIYGDFIEFINDLIPSMWAEKARDRSFEGCLQPRMLWREDEDWTRPRWRTFVAGQPAFDPWPVTGPGLEMGHPRVSLALDQYNPFVGRQSALVRVEDLDAERGRLRDAEAGRRGDAERAAGLPFVAGISQQQIAVRRGEGLAFEMYVRGSELAGMPVQVLLGRSYGVFFRAYARLEFTGISGTWQKCTGRLVPDATDDHAELAIGISGSGSFWLDKVSLMPEDNLQGWRADVVAAMRAMKPGIIRFGGSSLIFYQWQNGVGPRERRAPFENRPWGNLEENDVGLHEFLQFCELVDAQPLVCLNANSATLEQVMDEIEYCNGPEDSRWGAARSAMGHPQPFNVRYWQIGNEQEGPAYEQTLAEYAGAIRQRYEDLVLLASYPSDHMLAELSGAIDYVCPHLYDPYTPVMEDEMRALIEKIKRQAVNPNLRIGVTEWNHTAGHWGWARSWLFTLYNALNAARMFNMYQRLGDWVRIANRSNMVNSSCAGVIQTNATGLYVTPTYHVQRAYANLSGDVALAVHTGPGETLDLSATRAHADGTVSLAAVNCSGEAQARRIELSELNLTTPIARVWCLTGPGPDAVNSFEDPARVSPQETAIAWDGNDLRYEFPAYSVTIMRFGQRPAH